MKIYYDTEFLEDGETIELISIGMVAEDGRELYAIDADMPFKRVIADEWLRKNVVPSLPTTEPRQFRDGLPPHGELDHSHPDVRPRYQIARMVREFIQATPDVELWAWYSAYDHVVLCQLWGRMIDLPDGVPMWTNDLRQEAARFGDPPLPEQAEGLHNALADARHCKVMGEHLADHIARGESR